MDHGLFIINVQYTKKKVKSKNGNIAQLLTIKRPRIRNCEENKDDVGF